MSSWMIGRALLLWNRLSWHKISTDFDKQYMLTPVRLEDFSNSFTRLIQQEDKNKFLTHRTIEFLSWRYATNPNISYYLHYDDAMTCLIVFFL